MPQNPFGGKQPVGVIYITSMDRPDAPLTLAELYGFESKRESKMGAVCVAGSGLNAAIFCDMVFRFYVLGPARNGNQSLPVGLAAADPLPPDAAMVQPAIARKNEKGEQQYAHGVSKLSDTSLAEAVLRNGVIFSAESVMVLSAPATNLAKSLDLLGTKDLYKARVKRLVIVDSGAAQSDIPALRKLLTEWPTPIFYCGKQVGEALPFPAASIEKEFAWAPAHPVVDAYRAYKQMPYDAPSYDLAAAHYAVHPDSEFFQLSEAGTVSVGNDGRMKFSAGGGNIRSLIVDSSKRDQIVQALVAIASAKPLEPQQRFRRPTDATAPDAAGKSATTPPVVVKK